MTMATKTAALAWEEQRYTDYLREKYQAAKDTPETVAFLECVGPLIQLGWSRKSAVGDPPVVFRDNKLGYVVLSVRPSQENEGKLILSASGILGTEQVEFNAPEEVLAFVAEVEKELERLPIM